MVSPEHVQAFCAQLQNAQDKHSPTPFFWGGGVLTRRASSSSKWCVYSKLNISCWLIALTATHLLLLLSHRSWHEENSVIEKSRAWSLFAHIWQMGHHRFKGEHLETGGMGGWRWGSGGAEGEGWLWEELCQSVQVTIKKKEKGKRKVTLSKSLASAEIVLQQWEVQL